VPNHVDFEGAPQTNATDQMSHAWEDERVDEDRRLSFGDDAEQYDRARPSYPAAAVDAAVDGVNVRRVLDVGCGPVT
jgi:hypothetical protein